DCRPRPRCPLAVSRRAASGAKAVPTASTSFWRSRWWAWPSTKPWPGRRPRLEERAFSEVAAMEYVKLGRTGLKVSRLCLGCMNFGWTTGEAESVRIIHRALDAGINFLDTANVYGQGASETIVGKALKGRRHEDRKSTRLNSSHVKISYAVFCLKKKKKVKNSNAVKESRYK